MSNSLNIPFYASWATEISPGGAHCWQMSLKMVLGVLEPDTEYTTEELEHISHKYPSGGTWAATSLIWLVDKGYKVRHYDMSDIEQFAERGLVYMAEFYGEKAAEYAMKSSDIPYEQRIAKVFLKKVTNIQEPVTVEKIRELLADGWLVIVGVNSATFKGVDKYSGHWVVPIKVGQKTIEYHDPGPPGIANRKEPIELFQKAMDSFGGEMTAIKR